MDDDLARHEGVKADLRRRGLSFSAVARQLGVNGTTVSLVSRGRNRSRRIERALAIVLETTPEHLFPERYP
ncbi:helix-turn-helix domain-containing protein [Palleronia caenipelagi]|uniref:helix-turn-helix domain-containing protein n=1 Tax=Palleronia caenipelagi TaxID=2489174 RepID=UPI001FE97934|nr:helix-turn-helix domain-containing protein [Palleronia caenipelagi]